MEINKGFELREMCGEHIIIATGVENINFSKTLSLNESAAYLWNELSGKTFTAQDMATLLTQAYEVDEQTALEDATILATQWIEAGIVSE